MNRYLYTYSSILYYTPHTSSISHSILYNTSRKNAIDCGVKVTALAQTVAGTFPQFRGSQWSPDPVGLALPVPVCKRAIGDCVWFG